MAVNWTEDQQKVIDLRDCNILVSAAAGSGKTAVLVERIFAMMTDPVHPVDIDHLLIVTFTNAAAGEMRDRIRERLEQELEKEDLSEGQREHLQRQTSLVANAQISTIHSFCQYVIKNYFHTINLDPDFRIADEGEQNLLKNDVLTSLLEEKYAEHEETFLKMVDSFATGRDDHNIEELVLQIYDFSRSFPWPEVWLDQCKKAYDVTSETFWEMDWMKKLMDLIRKSLNDVYAQMQMTLAITLEKDGPYFYEDAIQSDLQKIEELLAVKNYQEAAEIFWNQDKWATLSRKKDPAVQEEKKERVKAFRESYKKLYKRIQEDYFYASPEELIGQMQKCAPVMACLVELVKEFSVRFAKEKERKGLCDFNDLEHFALHILVGSDPLNNSLSKVKENFMGSDPNMVARELSQYYEEILIDEYQDSNLVQELLLTSISRIPDGKYNIFMVGDVKQSIYRFRQARPELFTEKYETYSLKEGNLRRIDLHQNFRSREQVLDSTNRLFFQIMGKDLGNVEYDGAAALYPGAVFPPREGSDPIKNNSPEINENLMGSDPNNSAELLLLDMSDAQAEDVEENAKELEARMIGYRIQELLRDQEVWDKTENRYRKARYSDIVILLRTISGWAEVFSKKLNEMGIPVYTGSRTGYFSAPEVQTVLALLQLIDNPRQDIPMTAVLTSSIGGVSAEELARIKTTDRDKAFWENCMQQESLRAFFEMLEEFRDQSAYTPMQDLLWEILEKTGYLDYVTAMPAGEQRRANLEMLIEKAAAFEKGSYHGLYHFIRYIENLHKYEMDFGEAGLGSSEGNVVRIMSIHKSKGLEFPIVFVAGMGKNMNQMDSRSTFVLHPELGIGCDYVDPVLRIKNQTLLKKLMKTQIAQENLGEELRVLYVAMTRAKEKLILTGAVDKLEDKTQKWMQSSEQCSQVNINESETNENVQYKSRLSFTVRSSAATYLDWLMPAYFAEESDPFAKLKIVRTKALILEEVEHTATSMWRKELLTNVQTSQIISESAREILKKNLHFQYPYEASGQTPNKVSVSELKKLSYVQSDEECMQMYEEMAPVPLIPEFLREEKEVTGAARGTVFHRIMECMDFTRFMEDAKKTVLEEELDRMLLEGLVTQEDLVLAEYGKILKMLESPLAKRMARAQENGQLFREQQFFIQVNADTISEEWDPQETILIQGIIDAYFVENGEIVLVDYKTDFVKFQEASSLYQKYKVQLDYYEMALQRLTGLRVKEKMIYSFCLNKEIKG